VAIGVYTIILKLESNIRFEDISHLVYVSTSLAHVKLGVPLIFATFNFEERCVFTLVSQPPLITSEH